jgi:YVTN family beta-propeller protein
MKAPVLALLAALSLAFVGTFTASVAPAAAQQGFTRNTGGRVLILQRNSAGDNIHIIDPVTNTVIDEIDGIPITHGVSFHPDGSVYYISNEFDHTLDVVSTETLEVIKQIPLSGGPNNIAITPNG